MNFLAKYEELKKSIPVPATVQTGNENCEYIDYTHWCKDLYYCSSCFHLKNGAYSSYGVGKDLFDCLFTTFCELCYECTDCNQCYHSTYLYGCANCRNCYYCSMCVGCSDCFGCVSLTRKQYCIFNKQYSKEEYKKRLIDLKKQKPEEILTNLRKIEKNTPHPASIQRGNVNCPYGDNLNNSKNVYWGFDTYWLEDSGYVYFGGIAKNCWDMTFGGGDTSKGSVEGAQASELCYELVGAGVCYHCAFMEQANNCTNCYYSSYMRNCTDCIGCVGLTNKKYCVLNNQLTKEEYERTEKEIKRELGWQI